MISALIEPVFFTTSNVGGQGPAISQERTTLKDARSIADLQTLDIIVTCQGGDYTNAVYPQLRAAGWKGYWIDAASAPADEGRRRHYPGPGQPPGDRGRSGAG